MMSNLLMYFDVKSVKSKKKKPTTLNAKILNLFTHQ